MALSSSKFLLTGVIGLLVLIVFGADVAEFRTLIAAFAGAKNDGTQVKSNQHEIHLLDARVADMLSRLEKLEQQGNGSGGNTTTAATMKKEVKAVQQEIMYLRGGENNNKDDETARVATDTITPNTPAQEGQETSEGSDKSAMDIAAANTPPVAAENPMQTTESPTQQQAEGQSGDVNVVNTEAPQPADITASSTNDSTPGNENSDPNTFDPKLTIEDYEFLEHSWPTEDWLKSCATGLKDDPDLVKPFPTQRAMYALGDCMKLCNKCFNGLKRGENSSTTMAAYYGSRACSNGMKDIKNTTIMEEMFREFGQREAYVKPDPETVVIHLRLGDVIEYSGKSVEYMLLNGAIPKSHPSFGRGKKKAILSMKEYLTLLTGENATKVFIMGGSHKPDLYKNSRVYANCLARGLAKSGLQVEMNIDSGEADQDFYFMSNAKRIMRSTGGYSRFIGQIVERHGGKTVGPYW